MGTLLVVAGVLLATVVYLGSAIVFFARGDVFLGAVQLLIPPSELILPWFASPRLGFLSVVSLVLIYIGAPVRDRKDKGK